MTLPTRSIHYLDYCALASSNNSVLHSSGAHFKDLADLSQMREDVQHFLIVLLLHCMQSKIKQSEYPILPDSTLGLPIDPQSQAHSTPDPPLIHVFVTV